jgi:hypothetical protein
MNKCNCLSEVNKMLWEECEDERAKISTIICNNGNVKEAYPGLTATYHPKKKDGFYGKEKIIFLRPFFCPFCGKKY